MSLSWNEIKTRATSFSNEWKDTVREESDAKPFLIDFLNVFGISQKRVATFEHRVRKIDDASGYIDLLWPGTLLVEMKSRGQDLGKAYTQAKNYCHGLNDHELPKLIMICDFQYFHIYREDGLTIKFELPHLVENLQIFEELAGYQKRIYHEEDPVNIAAAELMGKLHDQLKEVGYTGSALEAYLVRLLFILFADDTTIFQKGIFFDYIEQRTKEDGSDLAMHIDQLFQVLDIPEDKRLITLDEQLNQFPYVNGSLFSERLPTAAFNSKMRLILLDCCKLDWGKISPAIFGSLFQSVIDAEERRNLGAHYTSEKNIMKLIKPLFLDELWDEFHLAGENHNKLRTLHGKISKLRFLDPACGCGNFLITSYKELRLLELAIVEKLLKGQMVTNVNQYFLVDLDQFYGIEIGEFPSQIAQVAMFLIDHQMNMLVSDKFGEYIPLIPLKKSAVIVNNNSLKIDWQTILINPSNEYFNYIFGNPPFVGERYQSVAQREELQELFGNSIKTDYVSAWFLKSALYMKQYPTYSAFVSTNSITQGEQVSILWGTLINKYNISIFFCHQTFKWNNESKGNAAVFCVIIGFAIKKNQSCKIYSYINRTDIQLVKSVARISPYLVESDNFFLNKIPKPISIYAPEMERGSDAVDKGIYLFTEEEKVEFLRKEPDSLIYFKRAYGAKEFINNIPRYCLWLAGASPSHLRSLKYIMEKIDLVKQFRPNNPSLFGSIRKPNHGYLFIPQMSSENRRYIPIGFLKQDTIPLGPHFFIDDAEIFHFGVLTSIMHITWVKQVCGRLKSDLRYSNSLVYNNFAWPDSPTEKQKKAVEESAKLVLDARAQFQDSSLTDLYHPNTMPPILLKAHQALDKAVDQCYRSEPFDSDAKRIEFLFKLYEKYMGGMFEIEKPKKLLKLKSDL
jgi:hypothetical protein